MKIRKEKLKYISEFFNKYLTNSDLKEILTRLEIKYQNGFFSLTKSKLIPALLNFYYQSKNYSKFVTVLRFFIEKIAGKYKYVDEKNQYYYHILTHIIQYDPEDFDKKSLTSMSQKINEVFAIIDKIAINKGKKLTRQKITSYFQGRTFFIVLRNGISKALNFETRNKGKNMLELFTVLFEHWQTNDFPLMRAEIRYLLFKQYPEINNDFVSNTVGNLRKKIEYSGLGNLITIKYNKKSDGYSLDIHDSPI
ncbi:hypothetical protein A2954_00505 [Candidatus Roizmanbacteria bacterium RIFCSPLOWO2_01_FULL_37_12]|uniref:Uncharacterized protein n=1 Tax=Candidatus Roizmanbacteria bacterium RIFCSPLOWO2_01_FULL_37_12 TaxID=1802056 RepID=A0A1F7I9S4_9BACT|nr:MAG: hypothetical protein A3D76_00860 [Candidatus Roizmanbacteria bacterium RIFCSPHIGHO2_02_FULL_37_9b]OGK40107.1 MAG: hypothetical protein A2954_00505 [Candidatus Roizmanbacteria bacterium RIFCSPLOWO2_01_FULL_37_12]